MWNLLKILMKINNNSENIYTCFSTKMLLDIKCFHTKRANLKLCAQITLIEVEVQYKLIYDRISDDF